MGSIAMVNYKENQKQSSHLKIVNEFFLNLHLKITIFEKRIQIRVSIWFHY